MEYLRHFLIFPFPPVMIMAAVLLDILAGDPKRMPHPVSAIGALIKKLETILRRLGLDGYAGGTVLCILTVLITVLSAALLLVIAGSLNNWALWFFSILIAWTCLAARSLHAESALVAKALERGDLDAARHNLSYIVGRDTENLDEESIWRATIETVAENASDGVIAPLFWLALGGPVAALGYKAASTLDSMVGYRNARYERMGRASARLDDLLNIIPARITAITIILASPLAGLSFRNALQVWLRDKNNHASPNSGHPEAAAAGALGVRLGGPSSYGGTVKQKPYIGDPLNRFDIKAYNGVIRLLYLSTVITVVAIVSAITLWRGYGF